MQLSPKMYDKFTMANNIEKLSGPIFVIDNSYDKYINEKLLINHNPRPYLPPGLRPESYQSLAVLQLIAKETGIIACRLDNIATKLQEDIAIIRVENGEDWLSYCHVSFPSGWKPDVVVGKSFQQIHQNIPGFVSSPNLVKSLLSGRFQRTVWSPIFENKLNQYPGESRPFSIDSPQFWLKIEKQITVGFPAEECFLFVMRQYIFDEKEVDLRVFCNTLRGMSPIQKQYKNISSQFENYLLTKAS